MPQRGAAYAAWVATFLVGLHFTTPLLGQGVSRVDLRSLQQATIDIRLFERPAPRTFTMARVSESSAHPTGETHWREGALIGGGLLGIFGFVVSGIDDGDSGGHVSTIGLTLGSAAVGALSGALIGGLFPRETKSDTTHVR